MGQGKCMLKNRVLQAAGTMSGTSLDGVDVAQIETDGHRIHGFGETAFRPYTDGEQAQLRDALGNWQDDDIADVSELIETAHAQALTPFEDAEVIGFHGQTLAHEPGGRGTHQAGDGQMLAEVLQKPVVWDFRKADVDLGGQGAPLAPFYHFALAKRIGATEPLAFLNLGGVANLTWIDPTAERPEDKGVMLAFDTGPANAPLNDLMRARLLQPYDADGATAQSGRVDGEIIGRFLTNAYFYRVPPKSLDRDAFALLLVDLKDHTTEDAAATLTAACALSVGEGLRYCPTPPTRILVAGGGRKNPTLMQMLSFSLDCPVMPVEEVELDGDMLEAQAFAHLAARVVNGLPTSCPTTTGVKAAVCGGTLSMPKSG